MHAQTAEGNVCARVCENDSNAHAAEVNDWRPGPRTWGSSLVLLQLVYTFEMISKLKKLKHHHQDETTLRTQHNRFQKLLESGLYFSVLGVTNGTQSDLIKKKKISLHSINIHLEA